MINNGKDFMRRKINVGPVLLNHWRSVFNLNHRNILYKSLLRPEHLDQEFVHNDRTFMLKGMTDSGTMILSEVVNNETIYWECTRAFVQQSFEVFNESFDGHTWEEIQYKRDHMFLPPIPKIHHLKKKKQKEQEAKQNTSIVDDVEIVTFQEDDESDESFD